MPVDAVEKILHGIRELDLEKEISSEGLPTQQTESLIEQTPFESLKQNASNHDKESEILISLGNYFPNRLGIQELFQEVDEDSDLPSAIPLKLLSTILRMNMEGRDLLKRFKERRRRKKNRMLLCRRPDEHAQSKAKF